MDLTLIVLQYPGAAFLEYDEVTAGNYLRTNESMSFQRQLVDITLYGEDQAGVRPILPTKPVPDGFSLAPWEPSMTGPVRSDYFGIPLRYALSEDFSLVDTTRLVRSPSNQLIFASLAFLAKLVKGTPVVLYWD